MHSSTTVSCTKENDLQKPVLWHSQGSTEWAPMDAHATRSLQMHKEIHTCCVAHELPPPSVPLSRCALLVVLGVQNLLAAHGTDALSVRTALAVLSLLQQAIYIVQLRSNAHVDTKCTRLGHVINRGHVAHEGRCYQAHHNIGHLVQGALARLALAVGGHPPAWRKPRHLPTDK